jgi:NTP pyrophosphatase (non-canonical NTP hydrolase)
MDINALTDEVEQISRAYASRFEINRDDTWFLLKLQEEVGELTQAHLTRTGRARTKGLTADEIDEAFRSEVADVLARTLLLARYHGIYHGIDLKAEIERTWLVWRDASPHAENRPAPRAVSLRPPAAQAASQRLCRPPTPQRHSVQGGDEHDLVAVVARGYPHGGRMTPYNCVSEALIEPFKAVAVADGELEVVEPHLSTQLVQPLHEDQTSTGPFMSGMHHDSTDGAPVEAHGGPTIHQDAHAHDFRALAQHAQPS